MKTGIELITQERKEQIEKHGFDVANEEFYSDNELIKAALFAINPYMSEWPNGWDEKFRLTIINKPNQIERLKIAGAFIAAEIDRMQLNNEG